MAQEPNAAVAIFDAHAGVETAVRSLQETGFDPKKVSVAGVCGTEGDQVLAYHSQGGSGMKYWERLGSFWGPLLGGLSGWAFFAFPGIGPVLVAGPLAGWIVATLENTGIFGDLSALGAGLYNIGISRAQVLACEAALRDGKYVVLVYGSAREVGGAKRTLALAGAESEQPPAEERGVASGVKDLALSKAS